jgi:hypothetical protein
VREWPATRGENAAHTAGVILAQADCLAPSRFSAGMALWVVFQPEREEQFT